MNITQEQLTAIRDLLENSNNRFPLVICGDGEKVIVVCIGCGGKKPMSRMLFIKHTPLCPNQKYWKAQQLLEKLVDKKRRKL